MIDVAEVNQRRWLGESGQWFENPTSSGRWQVSTTKSLNCTFNSRNTALN